MRIEAWRAARRTAAGEPAGGRVLRVWPGALGVLRAAAPGAYTFCSLRDPLQLVSAQTSLCVQLIYMTFLAEFFHASDGLEQLHYSEMRDSGWFEDDLSSST